MRGFFPAAVQKALLSSASGYVPISLDCNVKFPGSKIFRFESWWLKEPDPVDVVMNCWRSIRGSPYPAAACVMNLRRLCLALKKWSTSKRIQNRELKKDFFMMWTY